MLADSGEISFHNPEPQSESGDKLYTSQVAYFPGGFAVYGPQVVRETSQLQRNKLVTELPPQPPTDCGHSHRKPCRA
jgi:hypothetical protein